MRTFKTVTDSRILFNCFADVKAETAEEAEKIAVGLARHIAENLDLSGVNVHGMTCQLDTIEEIKAVKEFTEEAEEEAQTRASDAWI